ncbi:NAD(P)-dependent oxidoreductase [Arsenicibacter rosenii]|uniref:6-phosphogluconate dehydrogenase n=1 Tax=Arsenicibacter rosenii TaxID=1750698 RepID=A0A1S2VA27_9BACT|nr:DUF1932 domain-containing protein [Arsenicibacter rosenii]OIN55519.1 6-phosphogluconate dehydrogenase [Arsenicibacter rosenii]
MNIAILGLGEAGSRFANDLAGRGITVFGFDPSPRYPLHDAVQLMRSNAEAAQQADIILSVNLSAVSVAVAEDVRAYVSDQQIYAEMNTSGPETKQQIARLLALTGVRFVDLAIMAPVPPGGILTPFWASGPGAALFTEKLKGLNLNITLLGAEVGEASTLKLLRSIVYKGVAAVIVEAVEAGKAYGLEAYVRSQISSVIGGNDDLIDRFLTGSRTHAVRRSHEMEAVVSMLQSKGVEPLMSAATLGNLQKLSRENSR